MCAFHLTNREANRALNVVWNCTRLSNTTTPVYLGVRLDRTMCHKTHIEKTKMKVNARNNIIRKLANSKWGAGHRHSDSAASPSATQLPNTPAVPVRKLNPALHDCCRIISGCLKSTNLDSVHLLAGIAPPHIRKTDACRMECTRQTTDARHQLFHHRPAASRLKSRNAHSHVARLVREQQQTAALERQPDRRVSLRQHGTGGGPVYAGWIRRGLALLASA